ncbi:MAG: serine hydrolase domain-containing protein [Vicinamibacterales bacterium]
MYGDAKRLLKEAVHAGVFPAAVVEIGNVSGSQWTYAAGTIANENGEQAVSPDTVFDLASLTKVVATTTLAIRQVDTLILDLDSPIKDSFPTWCSKDRMVVTARDLLSHSSGLPAHAPLFRDHAGRKDFETAICSMPLAYRPRSQAIYSDLGYILLGLLLADRAPDGRPLDVQFRCLAKDRDWGDICFQPPISWAARIAPTELDHWRGRLLRGEVHDENCFALGGVSGHAGLFGTAMSVGAFARDTLRAIFGDTTFGKSETVQEFSRQSSVPGSSRALGWDTMLPTSSCGRWMSEEAFGHTGFTGTSLWIDPPQNKYVVLLTNRVNPTRENKGIEHFRPALHDAIMRKR